jgi:hypothetical protein
MPLLSIAIISLLAVSLVVKNITAINTNIGNKNAVIKGMKEK